MRVPDDRSERECYVQLESWRKQHRSSSSSSSSFHKAVDNKQGLVSLEGPMPSMAPSSCRREEIVAAVIRSESYKRQVGNSARRIITTTTSNGRDLVEEGVRFHKKGEYEQALQRFEEAMKVQVLRYGSNHPRTAHTLANIGSVYLRQGHLVKAEEALLKSLEIKELVRNRDRDKAAQQEIEVADALNNLGNLAYLQGNYTKSMQLYKQSLKELRTREGSDVDLANALHNIGRLHVIRKEWDAASNVLAQCRKIEEEIYGLESLEIADTLELIGYVYLTQGGFDNAIIHFSDVLSLHQKHSGPLHENIGTGLINVAMVLDAKGNAKGAFQTYQAAWEVFRSVGCNDRHRGYVAAMRGMENLKMRQHAEKQRQKAAMDAEFMSISCEIEQEERESQSKRQYLFERRDF